jgi:hypothetical protein
MFFFKHIYTHTYKKRLEKDLNPNPKGILPIVTQALITPTPMLENIQKTTRINMSQLMHEYKINIVHNQQKVVPSNVMQNKV